MRILFLYDFPLWGSGSGTYLRHLIYEMVKLGHRVGLVCPDERRFMEDKIKQYRVQAPQIPVFIGHPELRGAKRYSELSEREITEIYKAYLDTTLEAVENFKPDFLHVQHLSLITWVARYIKAIKGVRYFITSHGSCLHDILQDKRYLPLTSDAAKNAKAITFVSSDSRSKFIKIFGRDYSKNLFVIPGGVRIKDFPLQLDTAKTDTEYNLQGKKVVLFTGRLISNKGVEYLVKAAKEIQGEVLLVGDGPKKHQLEQLIAQQNIKNVRLLGYKSGQDLINLYYRADVFVAPSVWEEPLGLTILEAMAAQKPVIATRKGGIPSLLKNGHNGYFVKPRNAKEIADTCNKLLQNDELRKKMGEHARLSIEKRFDWKIITLKFDKLYKRYFNGKPKHNGNHNGKK